MDNAIFPPSQVKRDFPKLPTIPCSDVINIPVTQPGDLWLLGNHRLLCGDATKVADVKRLMADDLADMVFTDPPYNVNYKGYTKERLRLQQDNMSTKAFIHFLYQAFASCAMVVHDKASLYICHSSHYQREFQHALEVNGFEIRNQIIWAKHHFAWGFGRYKFQHEPIFYCHKKGHADPWYGDRTQTTLWQVKKPVANRLHPTMKPIPLIEIALKNSSQPKAIVLDLFGGSGSTLIACESLQRCARLMEIDPHYVDVIIQRWQQMTGKAAHLLGSQQTFADIKRQRHSLRHKK